MKTHTSEGAKIVEQIFEGMGKHFDKKLKPYYIKARAKFGKYHQSL